MFSLSRSEKTCDCGRCKGRYTDNLNAVYSGAEAVPLGFKNGSFAYAMHRQIELGEGIDFTAFAIREDCETFVREKV